MSTIRTSCPVPNAQERFPDPNLQAAFADGWRASDAGEPRVAPSATSDVAATAMRHAWLTGYDARAKVEASAFDLVLRLIDVLRRCDPELIANESNQTTDDEWDGLLFDAEQLVMAVAPGKLGCGRTRRRVDAASESALDTALIELPTMLDPVTRRLVVRYASALGSKLFGAQRKHGLTSEWADPDWLDECRAELLRHVAKGDPLDVGAYSAFLWHHKAMTTIAPATSTATEYVRDNQALATLLLLVSDVDATPDEIAAWSDADCELVERWASTLHFSASDNPVTVPPRPVFLRHVAQNARPSA